MPPRDPGTCDHKRNVTTDGPKWAGPGGPVSSLRRWFRDTFYSYGNSPTLGIPCVKWRRQEGRNEADTCTPGAGHRAGLPVGVSKLQPLPWPPCLLAAFFPQKPQVGDPKTNCPTACLLNFPSSNPTFSVHTFRHPEHKPHLVLLLFMYQAFISANLQSHLVPNNNNHKNNGTKGQMHF